MGVRSACTMYTKYLVTRPRRIYTFLQDLLPLVSEFLPLSSCISFELRLTSSFPCDGRCPGRGGYIKTRRVGEVGLGAREDHADGKMALWIASWTCKPLAFSFHEQHWPSLFSVTRTKHIIHPPSLGVTDGIVVPRCNDTAFHEDRLVRMFLPTLPRLFHPQAHRFSRSTCSIHVCWHPPWDGSIVPSRLGGWVKQDGISLRVVGS